jgi:hypothetical protein
MSLVALTWLASPAADAAPRAVARLDIIGDQFALGHFALAGDQLLFTRVSGRTLRVYTVAVDGGAPRVVFERTAPAGQDVYGTIAASPERAALVVGEGSADSDEGDRSQVLAGPPGGPLMPLSALVTDYPFPAFAQVDGERVFDYRFTGDRFDADVFAHDPDEHQVAFDDPDQGNSATFAGDLVAYRRPYEDWKQLVVRDWRTGAVRLTKTFPSAVYSILLRPDGRTTVELDNHELWDANPPRRLVGHASSPRLAGERIVYKTGSGMRVRDPDGTTRRFGTISHLTTSEIAADAEHVAWIANGCLLLARITDRAAAVPAAGPCPRTEFSVYPNRVVLARTLPIPLTCVSAPRHCHGTLQVTRYGRRIHFDVAPGHTRTLRAPLSDAGYRALRNRVKREHLGVSVSLTARSADGEIQRPSFVVGNRE